MKHTLLTLGVIAAPFLLYGVPSYADENLAQGWLFHSDATKGENITITGWAQASVADSNHGKQLAPATVFRHSDGFTLDQMGIMVEKKIKSNLISRVGPIPVEMPKDFDWGFNITAMYGADNFFFRTYGLDDDWSINKLGNFDRTDYYTTLTQAYLDFYLPYFNGSNLTIGLFHSPLGHEIGFALPSPAPANFYTHTYSFVHGPAKHTGVLWSSHLLNNPTTSKLSYELGLVRGYNNWQDIHNNWSLIANLRWRSADFKTWVDFENIYGNSTDDSVTSCLCGSPIPTSSALASDSSLKRFQSYLTISHDIDEKNSLAMEASYGYQEKSLFADILNQIPSTSLSNGGVDASWSGVNLSYKHKFNTQLSTSLRGEYFDTDGVNVMLPYAGKYKALTSNIAWSPVPYLRLRPEIRYDWYTGKAKPFGADKDTPPPLTQGQYDNQFSYSVDLTFFF
ncbi:outer membrane beta-barrel protein [Acinetobacter populi]|uniref:Porin n=1 Tax=Acinetobacter populi TaxID=1582270 RepID=A0A1Z9YVL9_9GAMM|nr:outer membrane beta-barrel protein [Acinetobacter populi]OUY06245.1 hypothetical protein CAP51_13300 [Acinetobacter populi]